MTKKATYYSLNYRKENPYHKDKNTLKTDVYIGITSMQKVIKEEVFVLTLQDLIGSVGGSLKHDVRKKEAKWPQKRG